MTVRLGVAVFEGHRRRCSAVAAALMVTLSVSIPLHLILVHHEFCPIHGGLVPEGHLANDQISSSKDDPSHNSAIDATLRSGATPGHNHAPADPEICPIIELMQSGEEGAALATLGVSPPTLIAEQLPFISKALTPPIPLLSLSPDHSPPHAPSLDC